MKPRMLRSMVGGALEAMTIQLQQAARHNAMVAMTALAERRREHDEVQAYLRSATESRPEGVSTRHVG